ncbi:UAP56-interacting factor-like [Paramormyrops kingsleyae]|uniref:UAP56-interacting factor n=1 Tax=Paramormyrops kingsleyae TaxID=1676925 RepID=A0A3B3QIT3_9TELE|nr:UAP56-interacting factor-like [Paramormyrops kingsleyae]
MRSLILMDGGLIVNGAEAYISLSLLRSKKNNQELSQNSMSGVGFNSGGSSGLRAGLGLGESSEGVDKIDMSLDDIIKLNRKEQKTIREGNHKLWANGHFQQGRRVGSWPGGAAQRGAGSGSARLGSRGRKIAAVVGRRRGQGVITGLAARRSAALRKGISPFNRPALTQRPRTLVKHRPTPNRQTDIHRRAPRQTDAQRAAAAGLRRPIQLRRWTPAPIHQTQRDARQATFLYRRGLKVCTQVQSPPAPPATQRTRPWRTSTTNTGILTVSIDNPTARTQPEPPRSWTLHPHIPAPGPLKEEEEEGEVERKPPKGVPLQFDINSVGKQTTMTLNERFRILKERRTAVRDSKGGRFVTVG